MELRREDLRKVMGTVDGIAAEIAEMRPAIRAPVATPAHSMAPHAGRVPNPTPPPAAPRRPRTVAPETMEGVVATAPTPGSAAQDDPVKEWEDKEGVERDGLFASQHAPALDAPAGMPAPAPVGLKRKKKTEMGKKKGKETEKEKGKGKEVAAAVPPKSHHTARQQARQAGVDRAAAEGAEKRAPSVTPAVPRSILKWPETNVVAEERQFMEKVARKVAARVRWENAEFSDEEGQAYSGAANPIKNLDAHDNDASLRAQQEVAHRAGMRAVEEYWEDLQERAAASVTQPTSSQQCPQPRQVQQQQQQRTHLVQQQQGARPPTAQQTQQQLQRVGNWAQRAAAAAALPQTSVSEFGRVGRGAKPAKETMGLEPIKGPIPWDERGIVFERTSGAPQIDLAVAVNAAAQVNIALSMVVPLHVRTEAFKISPQGRVTTAARAGASAAMLLRFKKEIIEAARRADRAIINVVANETWVELKILVPYAQYRHDSGKADLRDRIEAENERVVVPPFSMRWMRAKRHIEQHYQAGTLPQSATSVVFKVCSKVTGNKLLTEMWVDGVKFRALPFIADRADTLCGRCSGWGHSEFRCHQGGAPVCSICSGQHRTEQHRCKVATCGRTG